MSAHEFIDSGKSAKSLIGSRPDCPFIPVFGAPQVMFVKGKGTELWDSEGKRYLDFLCGLAVTSLGHSHDAISEAIASQASTLMHVSNFFANPIATTAAVELDALLGGGGQVFFCNSGAEANEAAIKLARKFGGRGRHTVVSAYGSFHGRTLAALAATGQPAKHEPFQPMPEGFKHVAYGDIDALAETIDPGVAAVLLESVQGEGGVVPAPEGYLRAVRDLCTQRGVLLILDEVQTGLARTGKWWGFEHDDIEPDAVCVAKALGNGMPVGALWAKKEIAAVFQPGDHGSTYSGTAIATAAASAVMQEMKRINAPQMAAENGAYLSKAVAAMSRVKSVRGRGLLLGVELVDGLDAKAVQLNLLHKGLVTNAVTATALRLAPPLNVSDAEMDEAISIIATEVG
jgi:predicted acetylornithine/succinylornithine family transaminase